MIFYFLISYFIYNYLITFITKPTRTQDMDPSAPPFPGAFAHITPTGEMLYFPDLAYIPEAERQNVDASEEVVEALKELHAAYYRSVRAVVKQLEAHAVQSYHYDSICKTEGTSEASFRIMEAIKAIEKKLQIISSIVEGLPIAAIGNLEDLKDLHKLIDVSTMSS